MMIRQEGQVMKRNIKYKQNKYEGKAKESKITYMRNTMNENAKKRNEHWYDMTDKHQEGYA